MTNKVSAIPVGRDKSDVADVAEGRRPSQHARTGTPRENLRQEVTAEIEAMTLFLLSDGRPIDQEAARELSRMEQHEVMPLGELIALHGYLAQAVAPAKPRSILSLQQGHAAGGWSGFLGPTPGVRRLTTASLFFALAFILISLSGEINTEAMSMSIYELSGVPLAIKLGLIMSAAGLGASFATLFSVWEDLRSHRYDPLAESASWMQIGLGVVAGLMLAEIIGADRVLVSEDGSGAGLGGMSEPLLALIGGFSAGVIHMILTTIVNALRRAFGYGRDEQDRRDLPQRTHAQIRTEQDAARETTARRPEKQPPEGA